jgi:hypothetical protein
VRAPSITLTFSVGMQILVSITQGYGSSRAAAIFFSRRVHSLMRLHFRVVLRVISVCWRFCEEATGRYWLCCASLRT